MAITKKNDVSSREFWKSAGDASLRVEQWPEWKRNLKLTKYSLGFDCNVSKNSDSKHSCKKEK